MPASLRSDYPLNPIATAGPFCPDWGATFTGLRRQPKAIDNNSYTGNTNNLQYFIYSGSFATATGNKTNTTLTNFIYTGIIII
jgi:hypothetical protein